MVKKLTATNIRTGNLSLSQEEKELLEAGDVSSIQIVGEKNRHIKTLEVEDWMVKSIRISVTDNGNLFYLMTFRKV